MRPRVAIVVNATSQLVNEPAMQYVMRWRMQPGGPIALVAAS